MLFHNFLRPWGLSLYLIPNLPVGPEHLYTAVTPSTPSLKQVPNPPSTTNRRVHQHLPSALCRMACPVWIFQRWKHTLQLPLGQLNYLPFKQVKTIYLFHLQTGHLPNIMLTRFSSSVVTQTLEWKFPWALLPALLPTSLHRGQEQTAPAG